MEKGKTWGGENVKGVDVGVVSRPFKSNHFLQINQSFNQ